MLDIKLIEREPEKVKDSLRKRGEDPSIIDEILELNKRRKTLITELNSLNAKKNQLSSKVAKASSEDERNRLIQESKSLDEDITSLRNQLREVEEKFNDLMLRVPNLVAPDVPVGESEEDNVVVRQEGEIRQFSFEPKPHWELGEKLGILDFERGVKIAGSRFYVLKGPLARLERALINFFLDYHVSKHGYHELYVPFVTKKEALIGAGQLPKFEDNLYHDWEDDIWLVPTAEVPLTNLYRDEILPGDIFPLNYVAYTPCFRKEKIHAGKDIRGLKRLHQFDKVEMYKITTPETSFEELEKLVEDACDILRELKLPFRVVLLSTGDLGFASMKTYDIEVWAPGIKQWLEVSSCSNCGDFQARRTNIRYRPHPKAKPRYVHTLNGSGLALPRVVIAIMENYQTEEGYIEIPEVLRPYMGGLDVIKPVDEYKPQVMIK